MLFTYLIYLINIDFINTNKMACPEFGIDFDILFPVLKYFEKKRTKFTYRSYFSGGKFDRF